MILLSNYNGKKMFQFFNIIRNLECKILSCLYYTFASLFGDLCHEFLTAAVRVAPVQLYINFIQRLWLTILSAYLMLLNNNIYSNLYYVSLPSHNHVFSKKYIQSCSRVC